ncbi:MAG: ABC transporter ATP-binding protein/permease [Christensenellales bacterium]|jgi:ABC-type transport system involved in cytochrome bd biosynthesis fused ATPase/permease subunit
MINKRLIALMGESKRFILGNVGYQWGMLLCNLLLVSMIGLLLNSSLVGQSILPAWPWALLVLGIASRHVFSVQAAKMSAQASAPVKAMLREKLYRKLTRLGASYHELVPTAEAVQVATEGVEQLETYYGAFLPQLLYSMIAPLTLFVFMAFIHLPTAIVLLVMVPLIPIAIVAVQRIAKKILSKHWGQYAKLGDSFLESLMGLTTLKIYQADGRKAEEMAEEAETFRVVTMKVLTMQLNSVTIMDIIAYSGAAAGLIFALIGYRSGSTTFLGSFVMIMLAAEFFLPLRALGSYFHTAMSGVAASDRLFRILDIEEPKQGQVEIGKSFDMTLSHLSFAYDDSRDILHDINMEFPHGGFFSIVGESGSGKSTIASILTGRSRKYTGSAAIGGVELSEIREESLMKNVTCIDHNSYLFKGTVEENLRLGKLDASRDEIWQALDRVKLSGFLRREKGLDTSVAENGANLSGGQRQRLALARGLLHDSPIYIFDEATSNIDVESENDIAAVIKELAGSKTVIMISHRLLNVTGSDRIYVLKGGNIAGAGRHDELLGSSEAYKALWNNQQELERYGVGR